MVTRKPSRTAMKQSEIIEHIRTTTGLSRKQVKEVFDQLASLAQHEVRVSGEFTLPGIGTLVRTHRKARQGRNPSTGEQITIPARRIVKFKASKPIKAAASGDNTTESDI
jgi:DNA-binding protein HU-beta